MRWQKPARWFVAIAGVATAVTLYVQTRERPATDLPQIATPADPAAISQTSQSSLVRYNGGKVEFQMVADGGERVYENNRIVWSKARFRIDDGTLLCADEIEGTGQGEDGIPAELRLTGNVCLDTSEGASIRATRATYTHATGVAILPGAVTFTRGRVSGGGTDGEYHRDTGVFHVRSNATVTSAGGGEEGPVTATALSMTFNRANLALLLEGDARVAHAKQTMTAERATLYLDETQDQFRVIELRGRSNVTPVAGQEGALPEMRARDIDLAFHEGTQTLERAVLVGGATMVLVEGGLRRSIDGQEISVTTAADGRTITQLEARDRVTVRTPAQGERAARTVTAQRLVAAGEDGNGLTSAVFTGGARLEEVEPAARGQKPRTRTGAAQTLTMRLGGSLDEVEEALFDGNTTFRDGEVTGDADLGTYQAAKGRLTLRPGATPKRLPRVTSGRVTVDARELIDVDLETQDLQARGDVRTVSTGDKNAATDSSSLFSDGETILGFGAEFWFEQEAGRARYQGSAAAPARLKQGDTDVMAQFLELFEETSDLDAKGAVDSTFVAAPPRGAEATGKPKRYRVTADTLTYRDTARTATYAGAPVTLTSPDGVTTSRTMVLTLAEESRDLERLDARVEVHAKIVQAAASPQGGSQEREALADSLLYEAALGQYTLRGTNPGLVIRAAGEKPGSCTEWRASVATFTTSTEQPEFPPQSGGVESKDVACTGALRR